MRTNLKCIFYFSCLFIVVAFSCFLPSDSVLAQDKPDNAESTLTGTNKPSNRIDLEFGYFTCRRQTFREIYGSYLDYGLNFQHRINSRWSWTLRTEFIRLHEKESIVKYWSLSETPMLIYTLSDRKTLVPIVGGGIGLTLRNVVLTFEEPQYYEGGSSGTIATQRELSAVLVTMTGFDLHVSQSVILGGRFYFDYHPLGDASTGDFGDTGGYHFTLRLGRKF